MGEYLTDFKSVIRCEIAAAEHLIDSDDNSYELAIEEILKCKGKVVITGVGKSGHIGKKMAATFASTGTPSFFIHSTEAAHGDLGMIEPNDLVILISNSGETKEVLAIIDSIKRIGCKTISITKNNNSNLSKNTDITLNYDFDKEADQLNLAPSVSSTLVLMIGDALALTVSKNKNFSNENFYLYHPGGSLGKKLYEDLKK